MQRNNKLALIVAYYLSKFDVIAIRNLEFDNTTSAFKTIGLKLSVKPNTIKNMRDDFDSIHENSRRGWYQRQLRPSRLKVAEEFQELSEDELREIVTEIIDNHEFRDTEHCNEIIEHIADNNKGRKRNDFVLRGPTGKKAEEAFIDYFNSNKLPVKGTLIDTRELGCGYDFEIHNGREKWFFEVKGLIGSSGGILFTNKEWQVAKEKKDNYFLVIVSNVTEDRYIKLIQDPSSKFEAKKNIYTTVQISWSVSQKDIKNIII